MCAKHTLSTAKFISGKSRRVNRAGRRQRAPSLSAASRPILRRPSRGLCVRQIKQDGVDLLDQTLLHGEEFGNEAIVGGRDALAFHPVLEAEADNRQHDATLSVDHRVPAIPEVATDEAARIESL